MKKLAPIVLAGLLALSACSSSDPATSASSGASGGTSTTGDLTYDVSSVQKDEAIAALLPDDIAAAGVLTIGASTDYAPAEFLADDLTTPIGYDVDLGKALGRVLGVSTTVTNAEFASIIPAIGTKYNIGISSFTVNEERIQQANMINYIELGSSFAVPTGNPKSVDITNLCGLSIGVQTGTWQNEEATRLAKECADAGKETLEVLPYAKQSEVTTNLVGGKIDIMYADSQVVSYAIALTEGTIEQVGDVQDAAPQGIVVAKKDAELTEAIQKAMQKLIDDGTWAKIAANWGVGAAVVKEAKLNSVEA